MRTYTRWRFLIPILLVLTACRLFAPDAVSRLPQSASQGAPQSMTQSAPQSAPESAPQSASESTTQSAPQSAPESTTQSAPQSATQDAAHSASQSAPSPTALQPLLPTATGSTLAPTRTAAPPAAALLPTAAPATSTPTPEQPSFTVNVHPDGSLYAGDTLSFEVLSPPGEKMDGLQVQLQLPDGDIAQADFGSYGIAARSQATFWWVWDTTAKSAGSHELTFSILPDGPTWSETITLLPEAALPPNLAQASWLTTESDCCLVSYISGTASERDLESLLAALDEQADHAMQSMGVELEQPIRVTFLPRVLGHGGFASNQVYLSYLDRNYAGSNSQIVFHHELVHILDDRLEAELRPDMLVEGLAVYLSEGHFKKEPLLARAAALLPPEPGCTPRADLSSPAADLQNLCGLDWYIPLDTLVDDFYQTQHEIGYLQAAALVEFMVDTWGWQRYMSFYRDIQPIPPAPDDLQDPGGPQYMAVEAALRQHFGLTIDRLEQGYLAALRQQPVTLAYLDDVRLSAEYYDTVRRYQQLLDPSAYFLTAWLPDGEQMRLRGIVADYLRQPLESRNLALELMLAAANRAYLQADTAQADNMLLLIQSVLDEVEAGNPQPFAQHPLAQDYLALVQAVLDAGYLPQKMSLGKDTARVWANAAGPELVELQFNRQAQAWSLASSQ